MTKPDIQAPTAALTEVEKYKLQVDLLCLECAQLKRALEDAERARDAADAEAARWIEENSKLWARIQHAADTLRGDLTPPTIAELRKLRGLAPL